MNLIKELHFNDDGRGKLISGISKLSKAVKSTLGAAGNTVLIQSHEHTHGITVTKDGVTVANSIYLDDPVENMAVQIMKEAAERTAKMAGDGTTTAIVLTEALVKSGTQLLSKGMNRTEVLRELNHQCSLVLKELSKRSKPVTKDKLQSVATISANNDKFIGAIIAKVFSQLSDNGIVTVEKSETSKTTYEITKGMKVERGYSSPLFVNDRKRNECVLDNPYVLVCDAEISSFMQIESVLGDIVKERKSLLVIAPCANAFVNTFAANVMKNNLKLCIIAPPHFGEGQYALMQDIALSVGATYFSQKTGDDLSLITMKDLGRCTRAVIGKEDTILRNEKVADGVAKRIEELWVAHGNSNYKNEREFIEKRIAFLSGSIGVIKVGGNTDLEQKELYDRVDDAVCAVKSALSEGILAGGGLPLYRIGERYLRMDSFNDCDKVVYEMLGHALKAPLMQILHNADLDEAVYEDCEGWSYGYDVKKRKYGYLTGMGIIDPVKVTKTALLNAVTVATTILSTNAIVTVKR